MRYFDREQNVVCQFVMSENFPVLTVVSKPPFYKNLE